MRYRLHTLLIAMAIGPIVLAWAWLAVAGLRPVSRAMALEVAIGISLSTVAGFVMFLAAVRLVEGIAELLVREHRR
jgi:hypothetical protein